MRILIKLFVLIIFLFACLTYIGSKIGMLLSSPNNLFVIGGLGLLIGSIAFVVLLGMNIVKDIVSEFEGK